jgi:hypothetical protein
LEDCYAKITNWLWEGGGTINGEYRPYWIPWPYLKNPDTYLRWKGFGDSQRLVTFQGSGIVQVVSPIDDVNYYYIAASPPSDAVSFFKSNDFAFAIQIGAKGRKAAVKFYRLSVHPPYFTTPYVPGMPDRVEFEEIGNCLLAQKIARFP